jgi:hypothetical protein
LNDHYDEEKKKYKINTSRCGLLLNENQKNKFAYFGLQYIDEAVALISIIL